MKTTPKDFFLWAGSMLALYVSVFSFVALMFEYVNRAYPDALSSYVDPYSSLIRFSIASLVILFPVYVGLMALIRKDIAQEPMKKDLWVRRWALMLTLFIAGATVAVDLITLVNTYLGGDITIRFALKVLIVLLVALGGFLHFLADIRGYWIAEPKKTRLVAIGAGILIIATVVSGVFIMGTPAQVRQYRFDDQKVSDLQNIQWQVVNYWQTYGKLPSELAQLNDSIGGYSVPSDPQTGDVYTYEVVTGAAHSFKLCTTFNAETQNVSASDLARPVSGVYGKDLMSDSWWHDAGQTCFTRTIDPVRYPVNPKGTN